MNLHITRAGPLQPFDDRRKALAVGVEGVDLTLVVHAGSHGQRLAAAACAIIEDLITLMRAGEIGDDLRPLVLHFEPALLKGEFGGDVRQAGWAFACGNANTLTGDVRGLRAAFLKNLQNLFTGRLQGIGTQIESRALIERLSLSQPALPECGLEGRLHPIGNVALNMGRRLGKGTGEKCLLSFSVRCGRREFVTIEFRCQFREALAPLTQQNSVAE